MSLYLLFLIYTPGPLKNMLQGGWGDLEKSHEPAAILMLAILWITIEFAKNQSSRALGITLLLALSALVLISPAAATFTIPYLFIAFAGFFICKRKIASFWMMGGMVLTGIFLISLLVINYLLTGVPDDQSLFIFWPIINFEKVKNWGVLFELLVIHHGKIALTRSAVPVSLTLIFNSFLCLRLDVWGPLLVLALSVFIVNLWKNKQKNLDKITLSICGGFLLLTFLLSLLASREQWISFYRFTSFAYAPTLIFCLLLLSEGSLQRNMRNFFFVWGFLSIWIYILPFSNLDTGKVRTIIKNGIHFVTGKYSIEDAYMHQEGWPGRLPWGGIYPPAKVVWSRLAPGTRVWNMHIHSYCMLPDCHFESHLSHRFSPHAQLVFFGNPKKAKIWLQKENLNYFFFSNVLQLNDPLPRSNLFSPDHIADYLGIAWTDGNNTLLTWKENASMPIDSAWLKKYNRAISKSVKINFKFPYKHMRIVLQTAEKKSRLQATDIPWNKHV